MKLNIAVMLLLAFVLLIACENDGINKNNLPGTDNTENKDQNADELQANAKKEPLVNFQCEMKDEYKFYFVENKAKIDSLDKETGEISRESWLIDNKYYIIMSVGETNYLVEYESTEVEINFEKMQEIYETSKDIEEYSCELNTVTENMVQLPVYEVITPQELQEKIAQEMMNNAGFIIS